MAGAPRIIINNNVVVATGSVTAPASHPIEITPIPNPGIVPISVRLVFVSDATVQAANVNAGHVQNNVIDVTLTNFDQSLGASMIEPIVIGTLAGTRRIFLYLAVHTIGQPPIYSRTVSYTFTVEGPGDV